ncbi:hypothetical protein NQ317_006008 [Molorchus minor]|uniref:Uncharacterized protein n=1 Tax=Molorchus minor TaxID=1323400 RepID=A0ABQ9J265_9CUCU|nr:hypothetical protein NQ317_006008 [Molorchus minor]
MYNILSPPSCWRVHHSPPSIQDPRPYLRPGSSFYNEADKITRTVVVYLVFESIAIGRGTFLQIREPSKFSKQVVQGRNFKRYKVESKYSSVGSAFVYQAEDVMVVMFEY